MPLPRLALPPLRGPAVEPGAFAAEHPVLWLGKEGPDGLLRPLAEDLDRRGARFRPALRVLPTPAPPSGRNPWAWRPHKEPPLRWDEAGCDRLEALPGRPDRLGGLVLVDVLAELPDFAARALLVQVVPLLVEDAPFLLVEPNGRYLPEVVRNLRRGEEDRGEGKGTLRSAEELRRLLEVCGFGIEQAFSLPGRRRDRLTRRVLGAPRLLLRGRRALREGKRPPGS